MSYLPGIVPAMRRTILLVLRAALIGALALAAAGCGTSYEERLRFLDRVNAQGIQYRMDLQRQDTQPSKDACEIGWNLLDVDIPSDGDGNYNEAWEKQVKEAYMKGCLTGQERPRPDVSGVDAVTPVPIGSEGPRVPRPGGSSSPSSLPAP